jgi:MSHA biogenesis protein MshP
VKSGRQSAGFALMMAIFVIVTMAAIGVYLVTVSTGQVAAVAQDQQGANAYQAARAGLEVGAYEVLRTPAPGTCTLTQTIALSQGLNGFHVTVGCTRVNAALESEAGGPEIFVYRLTATGCNVSGCAPVAPGATYVERQLQLTITRNGP